MKKAFSVSIILLLASMMFLSMGKREKGEPVKFEILDSSTQGGGSEQMNLVMKTDKDFRYIWDLTHRSIEPKPPLPDIDFNKEIAACVMMGQRNSSGYSVKVGNITAFADSVVINVLYDESGGMLTVMTYPYEIIKFPKTEKKIVFNTVSEGIEK